jgi:outer membrane protein assembly factor BamB
MHRLIAVVVVSLAVCGGVRGDDWPQWLGPGQASTWNETGLVETFPAGGPPVKWRAKVGYGYSGPAVADGKVFVTDYVSTKGEIANNPNGRARLEGRERVLCLSSKDGTELWSHAYDRPYEISYPAGPRATPTVDGEHVYTLGAEGDLICFQTGSGSIVWKKDLKVEYGVPSPLWGFSAAPLVDGNKLICMVGGAGSVVVAFDKLTGKELWRQLSSEDAGYSQPTIIEAGGTRQLIVWTPETINGLNPETGAVYWSQPLKPDYRMSIMVPRQSGNLLFASGIGNVAAVLKLAADKPAAEIIWTGKVNQTVYAANVTPLIVEGVVYGCDCRTGALTAADLHTGERLWETRQATTPTPRPIGHGTAFLVRQGDRYVLFSETGDLILAKLSPEKYEELDRTHLLDPTNEAFGRPVVWSHPAFAEKCVFARNDKELVCASLAAE